MAKIIKAVVPAAGLGTRLLPSTKSQPKEMLPVGRKPTIQYVVEELQAAGLQQLLIITGERKRAIEDHLDADPELVQALEQAGNEAVLEDLAYLESKSRFFFTRQSPLRGLGDAVSLAVDFVDGDDFAVALGDSLISASSPAALLQSMMAAQKRLRAAAIIAVETVTPEETYRYGIVDIGGVEPVPGKPVAVRDIVEKPPVESAPSTLAVAARYIFSPAIFSMLDRTLPGKGGEIQLTDAIKLLIQQGEPVYAWQLAPDQKRYNVGNFESYFRAFIDFSLADERYGYLVRKFVKSRAYEL
jgi:UTP--glucose-1-phosphate uridylyltransferase